MVPDYGRFLEAHVMTYQRPGTQLTPICERGVVKVTGSVEKLTCQLWGQWNDNNGHEIQPKDWEERIRFSICEGIDHAVSHVWTCIPACILSPTFRFHRWMC